MSCRVTAGGARARAVACVTYALEVLSRLRPRFRAAFQEIVERSDRVLAARLRKVDPIQDAAPGGGDGTQKDGGLVDERAVEGARLCGIVDGRRA